MGRPEVAAVQGRLEAMVQRWLAETADPFVDGLELIARLGLADLWNAREQALHPAGPRLVVAGPAGC